LGSGVAQISAGVFSTCALTTTGAVSCWGAGGSGQLGNGAFADSSVPVAVSGLSSGVTDIDVGDLFACATTTSGTAYCWGMNLAGQLGSGTSGGLSAVPVAVALASVAEISTADAVGSHACAVTTAGAAYCWGNNGLGQLGHGTTDSGTATPTLVSGLSSGIAHIDAAENHSCALSTGGAVQCWGFNGFGQVGDGTTTMRTTPVGVVGLGSGVASIDLGAHRSCAVAAAGTASCWGENGPGLNGVTFTTQSNTPIAVVSPDPSIAAITVGERHTCLRAVDGDTYCWGRNMEGELGTMTTIASYTLLPVSDPTL
jgi:alpha-tubulin suppressor-like RCC1 family protein